MASLPQSTLPAANTLHDAALKLLVSEINELINLSLSLSKSLGFLKTRLKTPFPKTCSKCGFVYQSFEDFFFGTDEIARGTICYPILGNDFYLHRNCKEPCGTTLVVVFIDRRDDSEHGGKRRELFDGCINRLVRNFAIDETLAREVLLSVLADQLTLKAQS